MTIPSHGKSFLSVLHPWQWAILATPVFLVLLVVYRLYLSPLAKFPGPKIAAITSLYAAYHDIVRGGQYIFIVEDMHRKYGPIVRIRPDVLHINDPEYIDQIFTRAPGARREKYKTTLNILQTPGSMMGTKDHDVHRRRRAHLNPFFSMQSIRRLEPIMHDVLTSLLARMDNWAGTSSPAPMSLAYRATTKDIIQAYCFGDGNRSLEADDLDVDFFTGVNPSVISHISNHFYFPMAWMQTLPPWLILKMMPTVLTFVQFLEGLFDRIDEIRNSREPPERKTIFHEILQADIPESEKSTVRLGDEAKVLLIAGMETAAQTLSALTYHLLANPPVLQRLKEELKEAMPDPNKLPNANKLDGLPYLNAIIQEVIRVHAGASIRQERVAPDQVLKYTSPDGKSYSIPAGTPVGMTAPLLNRLPSLYPEPFLFNPDRYLNDPSLSKYQLAFS